MAVRSITKRWLFNSFGIIVVIMVAMVIGVSAAMHSFYYSSVSQYINNRAEALSARLDAYAADAGSDFSARLYTLVQDFEYKDRIELMAINTGGEVFLSSSGFLPQDDSMPDLQEAKATGSSTGSYTGSWGDQKIMAITVLANLPGEDLLGLRYVVSMEAIDRQLTLITVFASLVAAAILLFVLYTSSYFMNSIIVPVGEVSRTAQRIAQGDFDVRLDTHSDDEIGQLCASINNMAEELSNAEQVKNDFISSVSHELRTPLTAIRGWGETLLDDDLDPGTRRKGMQVIMGETERLSQMVEELLDFSRIQGGRMVLSRENVDLIAELSDVVLMYTERARRENKTLRYEEPGGFLAVYADRNRLRQVFINILDNAIKYSDAGDTVTVSLWAENGSAVICIADTGIGIAPEDLPRVKNRFYKGKSTRRGSGIGLAVADEIINMHGGSLNLTSQREVGTTVTITLPLARG